MFLYKLVLWAYNLGKKNERDRIEKLMMQYDYSSPYPPQPASAEHTGSKTYEKAYDDYEKRLEIHRLVKQTFDHILKPTYVDKAGPRPIDGDGR